MNEFDYDWKPTSNRPHYDVGCAVAGLITNIVNSQLPEYLIYFPFQGPYRFEYYFKGNVTLFRLTNLTGAGVPVIGELKDDSLIDVAREIVARSKFPDFEIVYQEHQEFFEDESFIYVGTQDNLNFSWECAHCIAEDSYIYKASNINTKYPVKSIRKNDDVDLAIFGADGFGFQDGLEIGDSDLIALNDQVAVAGFPNHNFGDSGIFSPGLVVGFRPVSSIRRILINTPLIAGISGGPIVGKDSMVIGVAVTGADKMENASSTENHGVVPIAAIRLIDGSN